jgi:hypothetical protein
MVWSSRTVVFAFSLIAAAWSGACGSSSEHGSGFTADASIPDAGVGDDGAPTDAMRDATSSGSSDGPSLFGDGGFSDAPQVFDVEPSTLQTIMVTAGQTMPIVTYKATLAGAPIKAAWTVDRGDLATIAAGPSAKGCSSPPERPVAS